MKRCVEYKDLGDYNVSVLEVVLGFLDVPKLVFGVWWWWWWCTDGGNWMYG